MCGGGGGKGEYIEECRVGSEWDVEGKRGVSV